MTIQERLTSDEFTNDIYPLLRNYARKLTNDEDKGNDLLQDTIERIINNYHHYKEDRFPNWCVRVMRNVFINEWHRSKKFVDIQVNDGQSDSDDTYGNYLEILQHEGNLAYNTVEAESNLTCEEIMQHIDNLPERLVDIYKDYIINGMNSKEMSEKYNILDPTIRTRIFKAQSIIRPIITRLYNQDGIYKRTYIDKDYQKRKAKANVQKSGN